MRRATNPFWANVSAAEPASDDRDLRPFAPEDFGFGLHPEIARLVMAMGSSELVGSARDAQLELENDTTNGLRRYLRARQLNRDGRHGESD